MVTLSDIVVRYRRMRGDKTLWLPGTDHAAIATQEKVERELYKKEGKSRHDLGREEFLRRVDEFAKASHDGIVHQLKKLGASLDWSREAFTLDEARSRAVNWAFKEMYDAGLIYRGVRIVNWDPKLQTTVSDDEVEWKEEKTPFYYLKYGPFTIATARPETKFGDKYVVMHPEDGRYLKYNDGDEIVVEWINGPITATIVKDKAIDMSFGTGVMTITPWHDATDFEIAERHRLDKEQIIDNRGKLLPIAGEFAGKKIAEARPLIIEKLKAKGLVEKVDENYAHRVATSSRGGGTIEPQVMEQWFINVTKKFKLPHSKIAGIPAGSETTLKDIMMKAVEGGQVNIIPERFKNEYFHWINNLRDWCISRQIWYGHRIPVWRCATCGEARVNPEVKARWFFVRHGETDWNKEDRAMGQKDIPLNETGKAQARSIAGVLKNENIDLIITSDLARANETAEILKKELGVKEILTEANLRERSLGVAEGMLRKEMMKEHGDWYAYDNNPPGGESYKDLEKRAWDAFVKHRGNHGHKNVVIVSHGGTLRTLLRHIRNWGTEEMFDKQRVQHDEVIKFDVLENCSKCDSHLFEQDPDTLDTWFSSGLWTFSTLGWPEKTKDLETFHPTTLLVTAYDILFFWVARMILMTGFFLGDVPFKTAYIHGVVRDKEKKKMSKSKGNAIDPLGIAETYGTDAVRMALVVGNAPGTDPVVSEDKIRGYRNFTTKVWNIARFLNMNGVFAKGNGAAMNAADEQRIEEFKAVRAEMTGLMDTYQFHEASSRIYHYLWHEFADNIIEEAKPRLKASDAADAASARAMLQEIFKRSLALLHPFMPFVTESIYQDHYAPHAKGKMLMTEPW
jgi:valyl-tRNA synthetase